jgi:hypothetical protein
LREAIDAGLGIAHFHGPVTPTFCLGQLGRQHAIHIAAFLGGGSIGGDVGQPEGIYVCAPGKRHFRELRRNFFDRRPILRAMSNHQIVTL